MSGPKGYEVAVSPEVRRRLELEARRRMWTELAEQLSATTRLMYSDQLDFDVAARLAQLGFDAARCAHPAEADLDDIATFQAAQQLVLKEASAARATVLIERTRATLAQQFEEHGAQFTVTRLASSETKSNSEPSVSPVTRDDELLPLIASVEAQLRDPLARELADLVRDAVPASSPRWLVLTRKVTDAVRDERDREAKESAIADLGVLLARAGGPERDDLRARLRATTNLAEVVRLRPQVEAAVAAAQREAERVFVVEQALEVWRELGYQADSDFIVKTASGQPAFLYRDEWSDHAMQVRLAPDGHSLGTNIVAFGDTTALRDEEIEVASCALVGTFRDSLETRGLAAKLVRHNEPGTLPVQHVQGRHAERTAAVAEKEVKRHGA